MQYVTEKLINRMLRDLWPMELDAPLRVRDQRAKSEGDVFTLLDSLREPGPSPEEELARRDEVDRVFAAMADVLTPREERIMRLRLLEGYTLQEIGDLMGLSRERIRQVQTVAMRKLRRRLAAEEERHGLRRRAAR